MKRQEIVVSIPHAGTHIPSNIRSRIAHDDHRIRNESDLYTDRIYTVNDVRIVQSEFSRLIADPNRAPDEIYTEGALRSLGVVMLSLPEGHDVFTEDPTLEQMHEWIAKCHQPFHDKLQEAVRGARFLFDCHSMWSKAAAGHYGMAGKPRADIILGNQFFCTCSAETTQFVRAFFMERGLSVSINDPYPGRYILGTYCSRLGLPGLQVEINRKLYLNEETLDPIEPQITYFHDMFDELLNAFCNWFEGPTAAEDKPMVDLSLEEE